MAYPPKVDPISKTWVIAIDFKLDRVSYPAINGGASCFTGRWLVSKKGKRSTKMSAIT